MKGIFCGIWQLDRPSNLSRNPSHLLVCFPGACPCGCFFHLCNQLRHEFVSGGMVGMWIMPLHKPSACYFRELVDVLWMWLFSTDHSCHITAVHFLVNDATNGPLDYRKNPSFEILKAFDGISLFLVLWLPFKFISA